MNGNYAMPEKSATVIAVYSRRMQVEFAEGGIVDARIKGKALRPVCGDVVRVRPIEGEGDWLITGIDGRRNALTRPNLRGAAEVLAANVDVLVMVVAAAPPPDWYIADRYLCAAEIMRAESLVVCNKSDETRVRGTREALDQYRRIGYVVHETSVETGEGLDALQASIGHRTAILVGQSGVGKSSLINRLSVPSEQRIAAISRKTGEGKHTTVSSIMLPLAGGGAVIDSPGVRDYAPAFASLAEVERGFREIHAAAADCRFADCRHLREPDCAVRTAVDSGTIDARRYESYRRAVRLFERMQRRPY